ncbi:MAG: diacylglycerol/lipid kinase family protein [Candidatus Kapaibacterium sp.]
MKNKHLIIINPMSGVRKTLRDKSLINNALSKIPGNPEIVYTERRLHAVEIAKTYVERGCRRIIVVGGDGTLNEAVNGIFAQESCDPTEVTIGIMPVGTGNDWRRIYNIPPDYQKAVDIILKNKTVMQDVGIVKYFEDDDPKIRYFANVAGIGFDARVARRVNIAKERGRGGKLTYIKHLVASLINTKARDCIIDVDGNSFATKTFSMSVGIGKFNGGGILQLPHAIPDGGLLSATLIGALGKFEIIMNIHRIFDGSILKISKVKALKGKEIRFDSDEIFLLEADGETLGHSPFSFGIIPRALRAFSDDANPYIT